MILYGIDEAIVSAAKVTHNQMKTGSGKQVSW